MARSCFNAARPCSRGTVAPVLYCGCAFAAPPWGCFAGKAVNRARVGDESLPFSLSSPLLDRQEKAEARSKTRLCRESLALAARA